MGSLTDVSLTLTKHITQNKEGKGSNIVLSPLSIQVILNLIAAGSKDQTLEELLTFLKAKSSDQLNTLSSLIISVVSAGGSSSGEPLLSSMDNAVWIDKSVSFKSSFKKVVDKAYEAASQVVDFQNKPIESTDLLNSWVDNKTNGLIKDILRPGSIDILTMLAYANAIYFKRAWGTRFKVSDTKDYDFHLLNGSCVQVPFMTIPRKNINLLVPSKVLKCWDFLINSARKRKLNFLCTSSSPMQKMGCRH